MSTTKPAFNLGDLSDSFGSKDIPQEIAVKVERDDAESGKLSSSTGGSQHTLLGFNQAGMAFVIKKVVKDELWHNVKFIIDIDELDFNDEPGTICQFMIEKCNVKPEHSKVWWIKVAKKIISTSLTEHRNNKIKALQECTLDALRKNSGKLPFHKFSTDDLGIIKTTDGKITYYSGKLRNSGNNYIRMIDTYGPALVGVKRWERQRGSTWISDILTPSDEAFLLLAFLNYIDQWKFKYLTKGQRSNRKQDADPKPIFTHSVQPEKRQNKNGWSVEGIELFNQLHLLVRHDRATYGGKFNADFGKYAHDNPLKKSKGTGAKNSTTSIVRAYNDLVKTSESQEIF